MTRPLYFMRFLAFQVALFQLYLKQFLAIGTANHNRAFGARAKRKLDFVGGFTGVAQLFFHSIVIRLGS